MLRGAPAGTGMRLLRMAAAEPRAYTAAEAIALIHGAGGVASLAHPAKVQRGQPLLGAADVRPLVEAGFDALEAWQWIPGGWGSRALPVALAAELGLLVSGGSDDHGKRTADGRMRLGAQPIPNDVLEAAQGTGAGASASSKLYVSITGLASSWLHMRSTAARAAPRSAAWSSTWMSLPARTAHAAEAQAAQRAANRQSLRIVHRRLEHDADTVGALRETFSRRRAAATLRRSAPPCRR